MTDTSLAIPELSLVVLIGASGSGKSTFAARHFLPTEVISSDVCRGLVSDDTNDQNATPDAFDLVHFIAGKRLSRGRLTVIDATNVQRDSRKPLVALARAHDVLPVAIVLNLPQKLCERRNQSRSDRNFGSHVVRRQMSSLRRSLRGLRREGFRRVHVLESVEDVEAAVIRREKLWNDRRDDGGPFDIIGDVHGCADELDELLKRLGYELEAGGGARHSEGRRAIFVGDLVDRGPANRRVLDRVMAMVASEDAIAVPGNHDVKLAKKLAGRKVKIAHGLAATLAELEDAPQSDLDEIRGFIDSLVSHHVFDGGKLVVAHAGMKEEYQGRASGRVRNFALYGETTGETDEFGLPIRHDWASEYRGSAMVVYGHTPSPDAEWVGNTICIDTGCVFGGELTALRYPERELVSVPAAEVYCEPVRPLDHDKFDERPQFVLDITDITGRRLVRTRTGGTIAVDGESAAAALEIMSRFAVDPRWLIYLPPTMSPAASSTVDGYLEHPNEALDYFRRQGVSEVVCEEKHMGSRAIVVVCRNGDVAYHRFGVRGQRRGVIYTRSGRPFFGRQDVESAILERLDRALTAAGLWDALNTEWLCLDAELMPWSAKAQELIRSQYAAVAAAGELALKTAGEALARFAERTGDNSLSERYERRLEQVRRYAAAYRRYCWDVDGLDDYALAPFHVLATEGRLHTDQPHDWHMETVGQLADHDTLFRKTTYQTVSLESRDHCERLVAWWTELTEAGGEGVVVKPRAWLATGKKGRIVQPAIKCRGREYLRIIYGPEYDQGERLVQLRKRKVGRKRALATREAALGLEALQRFVEGEPLYRVHECVFAVLALETEPLDPRL